MQFREIKTTEDAIEAMAIEVRDGKLSNGQYVGLVENKMKEIAQSEHAVAVSSGTMGLKIALDAMGIRPGDMVIVPDITFVVCATVILELNAIPVFVDVDPVTYLLDMESTVRAVAVYSGKVKAIMAVRLGGEPIPEWVYGLGIPVIVDSAHSMDPLPPQALACVYSFHPSKIVSGIEGGCIATNSAGDAEHARQLRCFGFLEGSRVATALGYKAYMSNVSACLIWHNLCTLPQNLAKRAHIRDLLNAKLGLNHQGLGMYMVLSKHWLTVISKIPAIRHYPMTLSKMITGVQQSETASQLVDSLVSLPFHEHLTDGDVDLICDTITGIRTIKD